MKSMKKIGAVFLAFVLAFSLCATAFADDVIGNSDDTGTITVKGIEDTGVDKEDGSNSLAVTAYPILLAYYDANGNFAGYVSLYPGILGVNDIADSVQYTATTSDGTVVYQGYSEAAMQAAVDDYESENPEAEITKTTAITSDKLTEANLQAIENKIKSNQGVTTLDAAAQLLGYEDYDAMQTAGYSFADNAENALKGVDLEADDTDPTSYSATVPIGTYLVHISGAEAVEYSNAVVSTWYTSGESGNVIQSGTVDMINDGVAWVKAETPEVDKTIAGVNNEDYESTMSDGKTTNKGASANIGDTINYQVKVAAVPYMGGNYPYMTVTDTLSDGLTLATEADKVSVYVVIDADEETYYENLGYTVSEVDGEYHVVLAYDTDYTVTITNGADDTLAGASLKVDFVVDGSYTLNNFEGKTLYINYDAILNDNALMDQNPNDNDVVLEYTTDSTDEFGERSTPEKKTHTYTFDIDGYLEGNDGEKDVTWSGSITNGIITKTGEKVSEPQYDPGDGTEYTYNLPLADAEFTLYDENGDEYTNGDSDNRTSNFDNPVTSDSNGKLTITGLAEGTYYLKETKAPDGYALNNTVYKIEISAIYKEDGTLNSWTVKISASVAPYNDWTDCGSTSFTVDQTLQDPNMEVGAGTPFTKSDDGNTLTAAAGSIDNDTDIELHLTSSTTTENADGSSVTVNVYEYANTQENHKDNSVTSTAYTVIETIVKDAGGQEHVSYEYTKAVVTTGTDTEIRNTTTPELPNTGGIGTTLFYIIGALIIVAAIVLFVTMRRRNNRRTAE